MLARASSGLAFSQFNGDGNQRKRGPTVHGIVIAVEAPKKQQRDGQEDGARYGGSRSNRQRGFRGLPAGEHAPDDVLLVTNGMDRHADDVEDHHADQRVGGDGMNLLKRLISAADQEARGYDKHDQSKHEEDRVA